ncbi:MAG: DUF2892 domain-containing protein [Nanoarchaeota archaeon]|nr:DUF2892 domain-containing protein [Nanoarchaeota archaeon]
MKANLGSVDRILRFALAFWFLGPFKPEFGFVWLNWIVMIIGVIALVESFVGWCGLHSLFGINNKNQ